MNLLTSKKILAVLVSSALLSACGSSSNDATTEVPKPEVSEPEVVKYSTVVLDATDGTQAAKLDLVSGSAVTDTTWQIAYQKYAGFNLNGGVSADGKVSGCIAHQYTALYGADKEPVAEEFKKLTASSTVAAFNKVDENSCSDFKFDSLKTNINTNDWLDVTGQGAPVYSAKAGNGWIVKSADGEAYARVKVTNVEVAHGATHVYKATIASELWTGSVFDSAVETELDFSNQRVFWDLETNTLVTESDDWDLSLTVTGRDFPMQVNGGLSGTGKGGIAGLAKEMTAADVTDPQDRKQVYKYFADKADSILSSPGDYGALEYAVMPNSHDLWPTFTTYLIKDEAASGTRLFKAQVISNKGLNGGLDSGHLVWRYQEISL